MRSDQVAPSEHPDRTRPGAPSRPAVPSGPGGRTAGTGRRRRPAALLLLAAAVLTGCGSAQVEVPAPPAEGSVLDAADVLTDQEEQRLNALIERRGAASDAARVAVVVVEELGAPIEEWSREVAGAWGVGDEGADNGVLVVAATGDRELRIEVADGVRETFTDEEAQEVVDDVLAPAFADERYAQGLERTVDLVHRHAAGEEPVAEPTNRWLVGAVIGGTALLVVLLVGWAVADSRRRRRIADEELRAAEAADPDLRLSHDQREAYRKYRYSHRGDDAVVNPAVWLPLYLANPGLYSGGGSGGGDGSSGGGSSFGGGGGFTGGGASGSY
ncbi:TPM domain-containing protein [Kocuria sp. LUK]|uniref:TPM domain-containing protein n=1 Tax=Kocuria sp. LUK TaxID=2897828 RepID=UPI001E313079|nr:TPM domain-containing protein [Kocuria sp. LUK]MCD1144281.1 TPM domain-containing protein [Kocuria sp. LUK]